MKARIFLLVALVAMFAGCIHLPEDPVVTNLLVNPSFEELNEAGWAVGWKTDTNKGTPEFSIDQDVAYSGRNSLRVTTDPESRGNVWQEVYLEGGKIYRFSVWLRNDPGVVQQVIVRFRCWEDQTRSRQIYWGVEPSSERLRAFLQQAGTSQDTYISNDLLYIRGKWEADNTEWKELMVEFEVPASFESVFLRSELFVEYAQGSVWFDEVCIETVDVP